MKLTMDATLANTDWALLAHQKLALIQTIDAHYDRNYTTALQGLLHFIDAIQEAAELEGHKVVWLTEVGE